MKLLIYGITAGVLFGFLLQKARVLRYDKQLGALRLMDMTIVKFMLSSVLVAMVGVYLLKDLGLVTLSIKPTILGGTVVGGLLFGIGWGLFGYCPGTAVGALGEGRWDALWGILGMLTGAGHLRGGISPYEENSFNLGRFWCHYPATGAWGKSLVCYFHFCCCRNLAAAVV